MFLAVLAWRHALHAAWHAAQLQPMRSHAHPPAAPALPHAALPFLALNLHPCPPTLALCPPPPCRAAGDLVPSNGEQRKSHKLRVGRYAQHFVDTLDMSVSPVEYLLNRRVMV